MSELSDVQIRLAGLKDAALVALLVDCSIAVAIRRNVTPQQVLRDGIEQYGWNEEEWPKIRKGIKETLSRPS